MGQSGSSQSNDSVDRERQQDINELMCSLRDVQNTINILEKALRNPPTEATQEELQYVTTRLVSLRLSRDRAVRVLAQLGVEKID
jgi:hypothetical protein